MINFQSYLPVAVKIITALAVSSLFYPTTVHGFSVDRSLFNCGQRLLLNQKRHTSLFRRYDSLVATTSDAPRNEASRLKNELIESIKRFRTLKDRDGDVVVEFGVKGGELNETSRAPQKVNFYSVSKDVGDSAAKVMAICDQLSKISPIDEPTMFLGNAKNGTSAPLNGPWKSLFSTAADASFSKNSTRGSAKLQNIVDAKKGRITNVIDFDEREDGTKPALEQLNVVIKAKAVSRKRVELTFLYAKLVLNKFFFFPLFGRKLKIYIPVPAAFLTRLIIIWGKIISFVRKNSAPKAPPGAYFDILYLDRDLRIHKTGQDNLFIQVREEWKDANPLL